MWLPNRNALYEPRLNRSVRDRLGLKAVAIRASGGAPEKDQIKDISGGVCVKPRYAYKVPQHLPIRNDIHIEVEVLYAEQHSRPGQHVFVYFITLENRGQETVQLLRREWFIHDGNGEVGHVEGEGVVGEKPILEPGQAYQYNSFCPIAHPPGSMQGFYTFQNMLGELFRVEIPAFALRLPEAGSRTLN